MDIKTKEAVIGLTIETIGATNVVSITIDGEPLVARSSVDSAIHLFRGYVERQHVLLRAPVAAAPEPEPEPPAATPPATTPPAGDDTTSGE